MYRHARYFFFALAFLWLAPMSIAQEQLTMEKLFNSREFSGSFFRGGNWAEAGPVLLYIDADRETGASSLIEWNLETDSRRTLIDGADLEKPDSDGGLINVEDYQYSADGTKVLLYTDSERVWRLNTKGYYYVYDIEAGTVTPISDRAEGFQMFAKFNPQATQVAFVRDRDLFVVDLTTGVERQLTSNGSDGGIINGTFDWVYEEEFGLRDGFRWSPDGKNIAFFQLDESATRDFAMTDLTTLYPEYHEFRYPKAGETNSEVQIGTIDVASGNIRFFDTDTWNEGGDETEYIASMGWTPALADGSSDVWMLRLNRDQNKGDLMYGDPVTNGVRVVLHEENDSYLEVETGFSDLSTGTITYLKDGEHFVWRSDRDGYSHLFLYQNDGTFVNRITSGDWDVTDFHGVDESTGHVYFTSTAASPLERHLYYVELPETGKRQDDTPQPLTHESGWHGVDLSGDFSYFIDRYSNVSTPTITTLYDIAGESVEVLDDNQELIERLATYDIPPAEFITVPAADGTPLNAYIIRPSDFDPHNEYPLLIHTYGGPGSQEVRNSWSGTERLWHHFLAEEYGIIVAGVDNRGTGGRGKEFKTLTQLNLGPMEAEDQIAAAQHFGAWDYIDEDRMGIWGWSYGGYLTLLAMSYGEGPETFHAGVSVAPVSNWRFYDTIYTERYLSTPQKNPDGYDNGSPVTYAENFADHQELLIVHGSGDDNVHVQNTIVMSDALIAANKQFELMIYPGRNHGIFGGNTRMHLFTMITEFFRDNLAAPREIEDEETMIGGIN